MTPIRKRGWDARPTAASSCRRSRFATRRSPRARNRRSSTCRCAEADINQKLKEDPAAFDMMPGTIESAIVIEPVGRRGAREPIVWAAGASSTTSARSPTKRSSSHSSHSPRMRHRCIRFSLHQTSGAKFKSLIGRFRISYTQDDRIRELMLPAQSMLWSSIGPFPAQDVTKAYTTAFEPEKDIKDEPLDLKKSYTKVVLPPASKRRRREISAGRHANEAGRGQERLPRKKTRRLTKDASRQPAAPKSVPLPVRPRAMENPLPRRVPARSGRSRSGRCGRGRGSKARADGQAKPRSGQGEQGQRRRAGGKAWFRSDERGQGRSEARSRDGR